ncbi:uncharacterized protein DSM5745_00991 [Aspergillus mulundensis]|uniref:Uncharacterized protein n=1 Tax=Aspergillus mulundensis TaxID=1810919 RepID=A0A3D8T559_9EURO|nr:hypothetical protein DSM5745_00991 [Aspergillus mulundensis]RDW93669.1 hypothetical protein DSM5745_00991 [Aspergillus mulundensis]
MPPSALQPSKTLIFNQSHRNRPPYKMSTEGREWREWLLSRNQEMMDPNSLENQIAAERMQSWEQAHGMSRRLDAQGIEEEGTEEAETGTGRVGVAGNEDLDEEDQGASGDFSDTL